MCIVKSRHQLIFYLAKYFDGAFNIFQRMGSRRDKAQHDNLLGNNRIYNDRAKNIVILPQIDYNVSSLINGAIKEDRGYRRIRIADIEPILS